MNSSSTVEATFNLRDTVDQVIRQANNELPVERMQSLRALMDKAKSFKDRGLVRPTESAPTKRQDFYELYLKS